MQIVGCRFPASLPARDTRARLLIVLQSTNQPGPVDGQASRSRLCLEKQRVRENMPWQHVSPGDKTSGIVWENCPSPRQTVLGRTRMCIQIGAFQHRYSLTTWWLKELCRDLFHMFIHNLQTTAATSRFLYGATHCLLMSQKLSPDVTVLRICIYTL